MAKGTRKSGAKKSTGKKSRVPNAGGAKAGVPVEDLPTEELSAEDRAAMERLAPKSASGELPPELAAIEKSAAENLAPPPQATPSPGAQNPQQTVSSLLGEITWLLSMSPAHRYFFLADLEWLVMTPLMLTQFRLFRDDNGKPGGLVLWAYLDEEGEQRLQQGSTRIRPQDWKAGDRLWIIDIIDLTGGQKAQAMLEDTKKNVFKNQSFKYHQTDAQGRRQTVTVPGT